MLDQVKRFPDMILEAKENFSKVKLPLYSFESVVICGAGGSAIVGDLLKDILKYDFDKPIEVFTDYQIPGFVSNKTLAIVISYSGNTEETLSQFLQLRKRTNKIVAVSSGGRLEHWSRKFGITHVKVPSGYQPRAAVPYMLIPLVMYFGRLMKKSFDEDIYEAYREVQATETKFIEKRAARLLGKQIAIYGPNEFAGVVKRWKNDLNENAKLPVMWHVLPEMNHNEVVGYQNIELNKNRVVMFFRDRDESPQMRTRLDVTEKLIERNVDSVEEVWARGKSRLAKILSLVYGGAYLSALLAELQGIDAKRIEFIEILKSELDNRLATVMRLEEGEKNLN